ncbi:hypothetical protein L249_5335 [Ophiocordyceps polyrhachis-furcata BCC 54312]|uniref:CRIB domain-containing protein n=1 Tax=Ophiocordyceps polyrhachis-furcata BCC 54312 TaxID=1330021 RepID=A0A367L916_9HYPO|nr:hypothetical protein L249_5335 [Ophiocordyceps polyrhachis-furcata BCC 54312]
MAASSFSQPYQNFSTKSSLSSSFFDHTRSGPSMPGRISSPGIKQPSEDDNSSSNKSFRPLWRRHVRRASRFPRDRGHHATSSESSSQTLFALCQPPPWDHTPLGGLSSSFSPRSSTESSCAPSQHRPESIRAFGKILFHRRAKSKRDGRSRASSASSTYSVDASASSDFSLPAFFSRRKPLRDEPAPKKLHISGPFNFQHLAHRTRSHHSPGPCRRQVSGPTSQPSPDIEPQFDRFQHAAARRPPLLPHNTAPSTASAGLRQLSPLSQHHQPAMPSPGHGRTHPLFTSISSSSPPPAPSPTIERPRTGGSYVRVQPLCLMDLERELPPLPVFRGRRSMSEEEDEKEKEEENEQPSVVGLGLYEPSRQAPPEPTCTMPSRDGHPLSRRPSTASSWHRARQSMVGGCWHRASIASETLGLPDGAAQRRPMVMTEAGGDEDAASFRGSWEDDIDYCYEHEAEADCDFPWDRPSLETAREPNDEVSYGEAESVDSRRNLDSSHHPPGLLLSEDDDRRRHFGSDELAEAYRGWKLRTGCELPRSSASTVTDYSCGSDSTEKRHMSATSSRTTLTRRTASSSTSLDKFSMDSPCVPALESGADCPVPADVVPDLAPLFADRRRGNHKSHASESLLVDEPRLLAGFGSWPRRRRARTANSSTQTPPLTEQCYPLFPRAYSNESSHCRQEEASG